MYSSYDTEDALLAFIAAIGIIGLIVLGCLLIFAPDTDTDYCGSGWDAVCFEVPKGQQPQRDGNCISYDNNRICGSYETE